VAGVRQWLRGVIIEGLSAIGVRQRELAALIDASWSGGECFLQLLRAVGFGGAGEVVDGVDLAGSVIWRAFSRQYEGALLMEHPRRRPRRPKSHEGLL
jgi:hypothetical protein